MSDPTLVVVGAGPQGLALVLNLIERGPRWRDRITVIDPSGRWLGRWRDRFARHRIERLRSAAVHHPHPEPTQLRRHARRCDRLGELHDPYDLPGSDLFDHFCDRLLTDAGLHELVLAASAATVVADRNGAHVTLNDGRALEAARVVIATNPTQRRIPPEAATFDRPWRHSDDIDLREEGDLSGRRIDVVGGGLTAVQLAIGAAEQGADATLWSRRPLVARQFDVEPGWLGPRELDRYRRCDHRTRRRLIDEARGGGSVPAGDLERLRASATLHRVAGDALGRALASDADEVWLATGHVLDAGDDPLLGDLRRSVPTDLHDGLPRLDEHLAWPGTTVHLTGGYAALTLGPAARNLWGARQAADRIARVAAVRGPTAPRRAGHRP